MNNEVLNSFATAKLISVAKQPSSEEDAQWRFVKISLSETVFYHDEFFVDQVAVAIEIFKLAV